MLCATLGVLAFGSAAFTSCGGFGWAAGPPTTTTTSTVPASTSADWPMAGHDAAHTASNPAENTVGVGNVGSLELQWTAALAPGSDGRPAVANGVMFVGSHAGNIVALDANGVENCSGTPKTCAPLWTGLTGGAVDFSSPAVDNGVVYVGAEDGKLYAFDANGSTNCSGVPTTCEPLWTAQTGNGI
jgi:outer membrane protein assembly factor BamB